MKNKSTLIIGLLIIAVLVLYMVTFQVPYDKVVVVTTFGKAGANSVFRGDVAEGGGFIGNLHWKWPYPIQSVQKYDALINTLEDRLEQQQTLDNHSVVISTFVNWRVGDALLFYRSLGSVEEARSQLRSRLRDAHAVIGEFTFDELTNVDPNKLKIEEAEKSILEKLKNDIEKQQYGIEVVNVGVKRIILPQQVASKVFERMAATRQRLAQKARSEGDAAKNDIVARATSSKNKIMAFATSRAQQIKSEGDAAAAEFYGDFMKDEDFAIFLRKIESLREMLRNNTTFLIDTEITPFDLFVKKNDESVGTGKTKQAE